MLFFICIIVGILSIVSFILYHKLSKRLRYDGDYVWLEFIAVALGAIFCCGMIASTAGFCNYITAEADKEKHQQRYEILTYQVENNMYENDNEYGKKELMEKVQSWNENLAICQSIQDNFWIGIYVPNIYDQFEFIDYSEVK